MWLQFLVVQVQWFLEAWLPSVKVAEAAKAACVPRPDHAADATPILARKVTLYQPSIQPSGSIYFFKYGSSPVIPSSAVSEHSRAVFLGWKSVSES